jgi:hypothetical protein
MSPRIATNTEVSREDLLEFLRPRHRAKAEVLDVPEAVEPLVEYYRSISGEHPDWDEYREAMVRQGKSLLRITPRRWGPVATGGFPARLESTSPPPPSG